MVGGVLQVYDVLTPERLGFGPIEISSSSPLHAAAAVTLMSEGNFAVRAKSGEIIVPPFSKSGEEGVAEWWSQQRLRAGRSYLRDFFAWVEQETGGIAEALDSLRAVGENAPEIYRTEVGLVASALAEELRRTPN